MSPARAATSLVVGVLLLQIAWIAAVPPYRGSDEFDHVYRAASVARGQWKPEPIAAENGRGSLVTVPRRLVTDGTPVCSDYKYTGRDNCNPIEDVGAGMVTVASGATLYNPVYYWLIGTPARVADGATSLYLMRALAALGCLTLLWLAAWVTATWAQTRWPLAFLVLALTPVFIYSTIVPAANGLEMAAAVCVWQALLGLATPQGRVHATRLTLVAAAGSAVLLEVRMLGPLWWLIIASVTTAVVGPRTLWRSVAGLSTERILAALVVAAAGVSGVAWTLTSRQPSALEAVPVATQDRWGPSLEQVPLWVFQSVAAFPVRNEQAPTVVYAVGLVLIAGIIGFGFWQAGTRLRLALGVLILASLLIPLLVTLAVILTTGPVWQGRYTLPVAAGVVLTAGLALESAGFRHRLAGPALVAAGLCVFVMQVVSVANVHLDELDTSPLSGDDRWLTTPSWAVVLLATAGVAAWWFLLLRPSMAADPSSRPDVPSTHSALRRPTR